MLLQSRLHLCTESLLRLLKATTTHNLSVADQALAPKTGLRIERASDDFRPTLADRFAEVQQTSRRPPDDPKQPTTPPGWALASGHSTSDGVREFTSGSALSEAIRHQSRKRLRLRPSHQSTGISCLFRWNQRPCIPHSTFELIPPSTGTFVPRIQAEPSDNRNATTGAMSPGLSGRSMVFMSSSARAASVAMKSLQDGRVDRTGADQSGARKRAFEFPSAACGRNQMPDQLLCQMQRTHGERIYPQRRTCQPSRGR